MHFSIPETQEIKRGFKTFIIYNIYINGSFHCSLRYRQLHYFHLQLKKAFGANSLHEFPPKKILFNSNQIEERRSQLERYIQIASQDSQIVNSNIFNGFLLAAQQESHSDVISNDCIDIYQLDWQPHRLMINGNENSEIVLKKFCQTIKLQIGNSSYFSLYLVYRNANNNEYKLVRRLQNFESPLLTLRTMNKNLDSNNSNYVIIIHKSYWDINFDEDLYEDPVALNIIYLQTVNDVERGHIITNNDVKKRLNQLKANEDKLEYIKLARTKKFYGYIHFEKCYCDFILSKSSVQIFAGNQELIISVIESNEEYVFRVIRIKCWRLTTSNNLSNEVESISNEKNKGRFELSFEYLVNKGCLKWITIYSSQAVLISYCLQSMVEEMLLKREGKKFRSEGLNIRYNTSPGYNLVINKHNISNGTNSIINNSQWNYFKKDGSHIPLSSVHIQTDDQPAQTNFSKYKNEDNKMEQNSLVEQFQEIALVENGVFDEIGDDDL